MVPWELEVCHCRGLDPGCSCSVVAAIAAVVALGRVSLHGEGAGLEAPHAVRVPVPVQYSTVQYSAVQYSTVQCRQYSTVHVQYSTVSIYRPISRPGTRPNITSYQSLLSALPLYISILYLTSEREKEWYREWVNKKAFVFRRFWQHKWYKRWAK